MKKKLIRKIIFIIVILSLTMSFFIGCTDFREDENYIEENGFE